LLLQFGLLRSPVVDDQVKIYIGQSLAAAAYTIVAGVHENGLDLYVLAFLTVAFKAIAIPLLLRILTGRLDDAAKEVPLALNVPLTLILGVILTTIAYLATTPLHVTGVAHPSAAVAVAVAVSLLSLLLIATRLNSITQFIGFLSLDNAIYFGTVALAPGLPLVLGILIFFPLLIAVIVFAILVDLLARRVDSLAIDHLTDLRG
jgi:hydrogenase-4 component E